MNYILQKGDQKVHFLNTRLTFQDIKNLAIKKFKLKKEFTLSYVDLENDHINIQDQDDLEVCIFEFMEIHNENDLFELPIVISVNEANQVSEVEVTKATKDTKATNDIKKKESQGKGLTESPRLMAKSVDFELIKSSLTDNENHSTKSSKSEEEKFVKKEVDSKICASQSQFDVKTEDTKKDFTDIESQISDKVLSTLGSKIEEQISNQMDTLITKKISEICQRKKNEKQKKKEEKNNKKLAEAEEKKREKKT